MGSLDGKVTLITGGGAGIGRATAELFAEQGGRVCVVDVDAPAGEEVAAATGGIFIEADVGHAATTQRAVDECVASLGGLDIAFLNAGIALPDTELEELTLDQYERIIDVNVHGVSHGMRSAIGAMKSGGGGAIVATASLAGLIAYGPDPVYAATKHFVVGLVRAVAEKVVQSGITVNCVCPGMVDTAIISDDGRALIDEAGFPLMAPREIAEAVLQIVLDGSSGGAWVCQPGREPVNYRFRGVPGPRDPSVTGVKPPHVNVAR